MLWLSPFHHMLTHCVLTSASSWLSHVSEKSCPFFLLFLFTFCVCFLLFFFCLLFFVFVFALLIVYFVFGFVLFVCFVCLLFVCLLVLFFFFFFFLGGEEGVDRSSIHFAFSVIKQSLNSLELLSQCPKIGFFFLHLNIFVEENQFSTIFNFLQFSVSVGVNDSKC